MTESYSLGRSDSTEVEKQQDTRRENKRSKVGERQSDSVTAGMTHLNRSRPATESACLLQSDQGCQARPKACLSHAGEPKHNRSFF